MVDLSIQTIESLMCNPHNIRNFSVIAHVDHGKSTLTDNLVVKAKIAAQDSSTERYMDTRKDEQERGITIKSAGITLFHKIEEEVLKSWFNKKYEGTEFLMNLIDSPGHVDFSSEVTAALRVTDGAVVVLDTVDGVCVQTETVLRQAIDEKIKATLVLNKVDRALYELSMGIDELAQTLRQRVDNYNQCLSDIVGTNVDPDFIVNPLDPGKGEVVFASGFQGWGFTLRDFAKFYIKRLNTDNSAAGEAKLTKLLWSAKHSFTSDDCWDPEGRLDKTLNPSRSFFIVFVLRPIYKVLKFCNEGKVDEVLDFLKNYNVTIERSSLLGLEPGKNLFKVVMRTWLPVADVLLRQIIIQLPSPIEAQKYRAKNLYLGEEDECFKAIQTTQTGREDPLMMYISKMTPLSDSRFIGIGRVFSGVVYPGLKVRIQGPDYLPGKTEDLYHKSIQRTVLMMGRTFKDVSQCPAGNIIGLIGIDQALKKTGTVTNRANAHNIKNMKFSVSPVVKLSVRPKNPMDLPKLQDGLQKLSKSDPLCLVSCGENGELTVAGAGELHLEICLNDLKNEYANIEIIVDEPMVNYLEGVSGTFDKPKMAKSANKHNRIFMTVEPVPEIIIENLENEKLLAKDVKERVSKYQDICDIREEWVKKVMFYGPNDVGPSFMVDETKGIAHLNEIKDHLRAAFQNFTKSGPLIGEPVRGVRFNLVDCTLHADAIHRTSPQIMPPAIQVCTGLFLEAEPVLYEPIFKIEIDVSFNNVSQVYSLVASKQGAITESKMEGSSRPVLIGTLPVRESFGFNALLMEKTQGNANATLVFSHYSVLPGSMSDPKSILYQTVQKIREKRKMPPLKEADYYFDRL